MEDLRACPFCGSSNVVSRYADKAYVKCDDCDARGPEHGGGGPHTDYVDRLESVKSWNKRKR